MDLLRTRDSVRILAVLELDWRHNDTTVAPRPFHALSYRIRGDAVFSDGKTKRRATDGSLLYMPKNTGYHLKTGEEKLIVIHFEAPQAPPSSFEIIESGNRERTESLFATAADAWNKKEPGYYHRAMSVLYKIFEQMERQSMPVEQAKGQRRIEPGVKYLHEHFSDPDLDIPTLCALCGVSDTYFRRLFGAAYHTTPLKYIRRLRLEYAAELLQTGLYGVESAAGKSGFADPKYFSAAFKAKYGVAPSSFKGLSG